MSQSRALVVPDPAQYEVDLANEVRWTWETSLWVRVWLGDQSAGRARPWIIDVAVRVHAVRDGRVRGSERVRFVDVLSVSWYPENEPRNFRIFVFPA